MLVNQLIGGAIFLKHGAHGSPHYRVVWCSDDLSALHWSDVNKKKIHGTMMSSQLLRVESGHATKLMQERAPKNCDPFKCLSLVSSSRTLDLECVSNLDRDLWLLAFHFLIDFAAAVAHKNKVIPPSSSSSSIAAAPLPSSSSSSSSSFHASVFGVPSIKNIALVSSVDLLCEQLHQQQAANLSRMGSPTTSPKGTLTTTNTKTASNTTQSVEHQFAQLHTQIEDTKKRIEQHEQRIERFREDNRRLLIGSMRKCVRMQERLDDLHVENDQFRLVLAQADDEDDDATTFPSRPQQ